MLTKLIMSLKFLETLAIVLMTDNASPTCCRASFRCLGNYSIDESRRLRQRNGLVAADETRESRIGTYRPQRV